MNYLKFVLIFIPVFFQFVSCKNKPVSTPTHDMAPDTTTQESQVYAEVELTSDISHLTSNEKAMLKLMFQAAKIMDDIFWMEAYGDKEALLKGIKEEQLKSFALKNYGPWDRLENNNTFIKGHKEKPKGANFYPADMTKSEFDGLKDKNKSSQYTILRRDKNGAIEVVWYHDAFQEQIKKASFLLNQASVLAEDAGLKKYLESRAKALLTDIYQSSDLAWMDMKTSKLDFVVGPIENYEDALYGYKAAHEAYILIKDVAWSEKLAYYTKFLHQMQKEIPVDAKYKKEKPGQDVDLNAYDVVYYAGDCNAGSKTIAINLPNDEEVQLKKGSRKIQLKNVMKAKFDKIVVPLSDQLISPSQRKFVTFDAFFTNTMFHEVAHGLGIKKTIDGKRTVRDALKEYYSAVEEGKADILGLYIITKLSEMGEMKDEDLMTNYVTFLASTFRSIRFGAASAHGKANMIHFNYFTDLEAFVRDSNGKYSIDIEKMKSASNALTKDILILQGDGNYEGAKKMEENLAIIREGLKNDLKRLEGINIPKDIYFKQGPEVVGL